MSVLRANYKPPNYMFEAPDTLRVFGNGWEFVEEGRAEDFCGKAEERIGKAEDNLGKAEEK